MTDDRDWKWLHRPQPAAPTFAEHTLWTLTKGVKRAELRVRQHPLGHELRALYDRGSGDLSLLWSEVYRPGHGRGAGRRR